MAALKQLVDTKELKMNVIQSLIEGKANYFTRYDDQLDTLYILFTAPDTETIVHYIDDHLALLYLPGKKEVVGLQVEDFKQFAKKNNAVEKAWHISMNCDHFKNMGNLYTFKDKQERKVIREVAKLTQEYIYSAELSGK